MREENENMRLCGPVYVYDPFTGTRRGKRNLILPFDFGGRFLSEFVIIQEDAKLMKPLIIKAEMRSEDSG
jgi:hypothetical protein